MLNITNLAKQFTRHQILERTQQKKKTKTQIQFSESNLQSLTSLCFLSKRISDFINMEASLGDYGRWRCGRKKLEKLSFIMLYMYMHLFMMINIIFLRLIQNRQLIRRRIAGTVHSLRRSRIIEVCRKEVKLEASHGIRIWKVFFFLRIFCFRVCTGLRIRVTIYI